MKALDKISENLDKIKSNNKEIRIFLNKTVKSQLVDGSSDEVNRYLKQNEDLFIQTNNMISDFKLFSFSSNSEKMSNLRQLKMMESSENQLRHEFDTITYKISKKNKSIINNSSLSSSNFGKNKTNQGIEQTLQGEDLLYEDKMKDIREQNSIIEK